MAMIVTTHPPAYGPHARHGRSALGLLLAPVLFSSCHAETELASRARLGGETTVFDETANAFTYPAQNMETERRRLFYVGNSLFNENWVSAPASTEGRDGLGPTFNASSCSACHLKDGRGAPPATPSENLIGLLFRLSIPGTDEHGGIVPEPVYGDQLNPYAISGVPAEGDVHISYEELQGSYADDTPFTLRRPVYTLTELAFGPMHPDTLVSPRVAPAVIGLGLLEAIPEETLWALSDPDDADGDGISGKPNVVWDVQAQDWRLGRFGWKSNQPSLNQQNAGAFLGDMGITSPLFPNENCPSAQAACTEALHGGSPELDADGLAAVTYYTSTLAVPARRHLDDPQAQWGEQLFEQARCSSCHVSELITAINPEFPELSSQLIHPYTDLLLHDMGPALADHRPDFEATGQEWRTPPLWGIGLVSVVNRHSFFLHDGRARSLEEAILWHGGEAQASRDTFVAFSQEERSALLRFLETL